MIEAAKNKTIKEYRIELESILDDYTETLADLENLQQRLTKTTHELNQLRERSRLLEIKEQYFRAPMDTMVGGGSRWMVYVLCELSVALSDSAFCICAPEQALG